MDMLAEINFNALFTHEYFVVAFAWGVIGLVAVTAIIARQWRRVRVAEAEAGIKARMIDRGYSADEIETVLQAGLEAGKHKRRHRSAKDQACCTSDFVVGRAGT